MTRFRKCPHCDKKLVPCGTLSSYSMGCRCRECKDAKIAYEKQAQANRKERAARKLIGANPILPGGNA